MAASACVFCERSACHESRRITSHDPSSRARRHRRGCVDSVACVEIRPTASTLRFRIRNSPRGESSSSVVERLTKEGLPMVLWSSWWSASTFWRTMPACASSLARCPTATPTSPTSAASSCR
eukprot:7171301-Pyramimonas_sp.AAC.3